ncbi:unnamed protein product [Symbiodinium natans]|uniref:Uncharacterized protein n=1 Tax=Symbiodinium natans TaxID=878477 RepID=A0A812TZN4_9DINO|nr:unnamed protein product [Symbiodinium natans]
MFFNFQAFILAWCAPTFGQDQLLYLSFIVIAYNSSMLTAGLRPGLAAPLAALGEECPEGLGHGKADVYTICGAAHSAFHDLDTSKGQEVAEGTLAFTVFLCPIVRHSVAFVYFFTALSTLFYATYQRRRRVELDTDEATMKDFALMLTGFPEEEGEEAPPPPPPPATDVQNYAAEPTWSPPCEMETDRVNFVRRATGCQPVGVSICWKYNSLEAAGRSMTQLCSVREKLGFPAQVEELLVRETWLWSKVWPVCIPEMLELHVSQGRDSCGPMKSTSTLLLGCTHGVRLLAGLRRY